MIGKTLLVTKDSNEHCTLNTLQLFEKLSRFFILSIQVDVPQYLRLEKVKTQKIKFLIYASFNLTIKICYFVYKYYIRAIVGHLYIA